jgi:hypothetical protein
MKFPVMSFKLGVVSHQQLAISGKLSGNSQIVLSSYLNLNLTLNLILNLLSFTFFLASCFCSYGITKSKILFVDKFCVLS